MFDLNGKVCLVTGGSRGIGRACAEALAARGAHVVIGYAGNEAAAREAAAACEALGGKAELCQFDVSQTAAAEAAVAEVAKRLGRLDVLVLSAGISLDGLLLRLKDDDFDRTLAARAPRPRAIGVGFELARVADIRPQPHDIRLDAVVTEAGVFST